VGLGIVRLWEGRYTEAVLRPQGERRMLRPTPRRLLCSPIIIVCVALLFRLILLYLAWHRPGGLPDAVGPYGYEVGRVAKSIVEGKGFSSPLPLVETGPTAWLCPIYPYFVAAIFKVWGTYTTQSHVILQGLNCLFSALTIFPIYAIAKRSFGAGVAVLAAWLWVFLPSAWHMPIQYVWDTTLSALWFALIFWGTLAMSEQRSMIEWAGYGALWAIGTLINASFLSVFPFLLLWLAWETRKQPSWLRSIAIALVVFGLGVTPWTVRNYRAFGKLIPLRNNAGIMLWHGNNPIAPGLDSYAMAPFLYQPEADDYKRLGEVAYMDKKQSEAIAFIRSHPAETFGLFFRRFWTNWFSVTDRPNSSWSADPPYVKAYFFLNALMILSAWSGVGLALRTGNRDAVPYLIVLLFYPLVYYVTATLLRYRFPIDPLLTILAVYGGSAMLVWSRGETVESQAAILDFAEPVTPVHPIQRGE
jgi:hypothetical protein